MLENTVFCGGKHLYCIHIKHTVQLASMKQYAVVVTRFPKEADGGVGGAVLGLRQCRSIRD